MRGIFMVATPERRTQCVRIVPKVGNAIRIALAYPVDLVMGNGAVYMGGIYAQPTDSNSTISGGATVIDFGSVYDTDTITYDQIQSGYWDGAQVYSFFTDWAYPVEDEEEGVLFEFGKVREEGDRFVVELMGQADKLNQNIGDIHNSLCPWTFTDQSINGNIIASDKSKCKLVHEDFTHTGTITSVVNSVTLVDSALNGIFVDDWLGNGEFMFTTGTNAGAAFRVIKTHASDGTITLNEPFYYEVSVGDQYKAITGCRKRFTEDCINKFANGVRHGGFPHIPTTSTVIKFGGQGE